MHRTESSLRVVSVCLAALAGFVDALAFTSLGGFFVSFMSGNSTRFGTGLATGVASDAAVAGSLVMSFVSGVIVASVIERTRPVRHREMVMIVATALLAAAAVMAGLEPGPIVLLLLATAMGCINGVASRQGEAAFGITYMTGALVRTGQKLAGALMGDPDRTGWIAYLVLWLGFVAGVTMGAAAQLRWGWTALWLAPIASAALTLVLTRTRRPLPPSLRVVH